MLIKIFRGIIDVFIAVFLVIALLITVITHGVFDSRKCAEAVCTAEFDNALKQEVIETVSSLGSVVDISGEDVLKAIGEENLINYAHQYTFDFFEAVNNGTAFKPQDFNDGKLETYIYEYIESFEAGVSEEEIQEIYELTFKNAEKTVKYIPGLIEQIIPKLSKPIQLVGFLPDIEIFVYILSVVLILINIVISEKTKRLDVVFGLLSALFCVLAAFAIPLFMISVYDIPSKIAMEGSLLIYLIKGLNDILLINALTVIGIAFIISAVLLIITVIMLAKRNVIKKEEKNS